MANDEGWLHDCRKLDVAVPLMLPLELIQQGLVSCLGEARENRKSDRCTGFVSVPADPGMCRENVILLPLHTQFSRRVKLLVNYDSSSMHVASREVSVCPFSDIYYKNKSFINDMQPNIAVLSTNPLYSVDHMDTDRSQPSQIQVII